MRRAALLTLLILVGCSAKAPVPAPIKDWSITVGFNYDFTNFPVCSATVTKGCITGFTWGYTQGTVSTPLKTSTTTICTGSTQPLACVDTANSTLGIGPTTFYAIANGIDNNGNSVSSGQSAPSAVLNIVIGTPTGVTGSAK